MAERKRLTLIAALSCSFALGSAQSQSSSSTRTKVRQTTNYIDTLDAYSSLSSCAIDVLSTVVRGEFSGCGAWDNLLTSYTCFCTDSYSFMSTVISTDVITSCNGGPVASAQATSALAVFDEYCALGVEAGLEPTSGSPTPRHKATPGATGVSSTATATPTAGSAPGSSSARTTAIAVGIVVPVVVIAIAASALLIWRQRRRASAAGWDQWDSGNKSAYGGNGARVRDANAVEAPTSEHKAPESPYTPHNTSEMGSYQYTTPEMPTTQHRHELPG